MVPIAFLSFCMRSSCAASFVKSSCFCRKPNHKKKKRKISRDKPTHTQTQTQTHTHRHRHRHTHTHTHTDARKRIHTALEPNRSYVDGLANVHLLKSLVVFSLLGAQWLPQLIQVLNGICCSVLPDGDDSSKLLLSFLVHTPKNQGEGADTERARVRAEQQAAQHTQPSAG